MHYFYFIRKFISILIIIFWYGSAIAQSTDQNYPVTAQAFVVAQPGKKLSAYFSNTQALTVSLLLKDLTKTSIDVYLRWSIDGPGVRIASVDGYIPPLHFNLQRGMLQRFSGLDLQSMYFRQDLMEAQGLTGPPTRASLPEGFYTFRVQALEAGTGREVSNLGETYFSITSPLPPVINIPFNGSTLASTGSTTGSLSSSKGPIQVQWMPRHYKLPNSITSYDLKVCKIPDGYEPQEAMDACANPIIDDKGNPGTFYPSNTGIGNSIIGAWEQGARYAARVTVHEFDTNGEEVVFANEGRSEVTWFRYGEPCLSPERFTMKETGPGRVQLSWGAQAGVASYKILYRLFDENNWKVQAVAGNTGVIQGLTKGKYEFAVQSGCTGQIPDHTQTWEMGIGEDELDELPPALVSPLQILVQVSGCNAVAAGNLADYYANYPRTDVPGGSSSPADSTKLKIPACALQSGAFADCDAALPVIPVPTGSTSLNDLKPGDVLGIYDFAAFVTEATQTPSGFSGKALVRLPFLQGALALAEFSGLKAWSAKGEGSPAGGNPARGGCVYDVTIFQLINVSQTEVAEAKAKLLNTLAKQTDAAAFAGTLAGALLAYDRMSPMATADSLCRYKTAILQATGQITDALTELDSDHPVVTAMLKDLKTIADSLQAGNIVDHITDKYEAILARLDSLKAADTDTNPSVMAIGNVQINELTGQSARISWEATGDVAKTPSRYIIEYTDPNGATLPESVTSPQVNLQRLLPGTQYKYRITAYDGDRVLATYGEDAFTTPKKVVPMPENLAYTAVGSDSVRITWDANREHQSYKLIYTDESGNPRILYPTTNSAILTGLVPNKYYDYEIVAYNNERLASNPANARVAAGKQCNLGLTVFNAQNSPGITGNTQTLLLTGCLSLPNPFGSFNEYPKVSWSNGTPGIIGADGLIIFGDGERAEINTKHSLAGVKRTTLVVDPTQNKSYTAICKMSATAEPCTYTVHVKVSSLDCENDFKISVVPTTIENDQDITLKASTCNGQIQWSSALGNLQEITIAPTADMTIYATCSNGEKICRSNNISLHASAKPCDLEIYLYSQVVGNSLGGLFTNRVLEFGHTGCKNGQVTWNTSGKFKDQYSNGTGVWRVTKVKSDITVTAKCTLPGEKSPCKEVSFTTSPPVKKCNDLNLGISYLDQKPGYVAVSSTSSAITISNSQGKTFESSLSDTGKNIAYVPALATDEIYQAKFENECVYNIKVPAYTLAIDWISGGKTMTGDSKDLTTIANGYTLDMILRTNSLSTCNGKTVWSNDKDDTIFEGTTLRFAKTLNASSIPFPKLTTTYYASCHVTDDEGVTRIFPASNNKTIVVNSNYCFMIDQDVVRPAKGEKVKLTATGCTNAIWTQGDRDLGQGHEIGVTPLPATIPGIVTYTANCPELGCSELIDIQVQPCNFKITTPKTLVKIAETVVLTSSGCSGGIVQWSTGEAGEHISVKPLEQTSLVASCTVNGQEICTSNTIIIKVDNLAPDDIECPVFTLTATPNPFKGCVGQEVKVSPSGCPVSGKVTWNDGSITHGDEKRSFVLKVKTVIRATCSSLYDTPEHPLKVTAKLEIIATDNSALNVGKVDPVYRYYPYTMSAFGCYNADCSNGDYQWKNKTTPSSPTLYGASVTTTINQPTTFEVRCNGEVKTIRVEVKEPQDCQRKAYNFVTLGNSVKLSVNDNCSSRYNITWFDYLTNAVVATNTTSIKVPKDGRQYFVVCASASGAPCTESITAPIDAGAGSGGITREDPIIPDPCKNLEINSVKTLKDQDEDLYLQSAFCPGTVEWFSASDRNPGSRVATISNGTMHYVGPIKNPTTYYYTCFTQGSECKGKALTNPATASKREAAAAPIISTVVDEQCSNTISLSAAMAPQLATLVCQLLELARGNDNAISDDEAKQLLNNVEKGIQAQYEGLQISFPAASPQLLQAVKDGNCTLAGQLLAAPNQTTDINTSTFNEEKNDAHDNILDFVTNNMAEPMFSLPILAPDGSFLTTSFQTVLCSSTLRSKNYYTVAGYRQGSPIGIALNNASQDQYFWNPAIKNYAKVVSWNGLSPVFGAGLANASYAKEAPTSGYWTVFYNEQGAVTFRKMVAGKVVTELGPNACVATTSINGQPLPRGILPDEEVTSDCREYIAQLATAYTNKKTVPLYFKSIADAVQNCEEISLDGKIFKNVVIAQYGLKPGDKTYIDPAIRTDYQESGKTGFDINGHLRILCDPGDLEALRGIIWSARKPKTVILFVNGYRNWLDVREFSAENPQTKNQIVMQDNVDNQKSYWNGVDASFLSRRKAEKAYYADGHHSILTSNHNVNNDVTASKLAFGANMDCMIGESEYNLCFRPSLHVTPNMTGFGTRVTNGHLAGANWVTQLLRDYPGLSSGTETITIDIVAHSMGFAYAQGIIEVIRASSIKNNVKWSGYYILAPENGGAGDVKNLPFEEIWQYGSDLGQADADPMWLQDGVAPQAGVGGINNLPSGNTKGGRAFTPKNQNIPKGFVESHSIVNYGWLFSIENPQTPGYVTPN